MSSGTGHSRKTHFANVGTDTLLAHPQIKTEKNSSLVFSLCVFGFYFYRNLTNFNCTSGSSRLPYFNISGLEKKSQFFPVTSAALDCINTILPVKINFFQHILIAATLV